MAMDHPRESHAREAFDALLTKPALADARARLEAGLLEHQMSFHGHTVCNVLRPLFLSEESVAALSSSTRLVASAIHKVSSTLFRDQSLRRRIGMGPERERLLAFDRRPSTELLARLDGFRNERGTVQFIEYNPGTPGGFVFTDILSELFESMEVVKRLGDKVPLRSLRMAHHVPSALLSSCRSAGLEGRPRLTIIATSAESAGIETMTELSVIRGLLMNAGFELHLSHAQAIHRGADGLYDGALRLDAVLVLDWEELIAQLSPEHGFWQCVEEGSVHLINSLANWYLRGNKAVFSLLSDPEFSGLFDTETNQALDSHIPWTRLLREGNTLRAGRALDLLPYVLEQRNELVLKPAYSYGGQGVVLGWTVDDATWSAAVLAALGGAPHVVQERVQLAQQTFPCLIEGNVTQQSRYYDINPYIWNESRVEGMMVRVSADPLLNVTAGTGSMTAPLICR